MDKKKNTFICDMCHKIEEKGPDGEAEKEMLEIWGYIPPEERARVCDECFEKIRGMKEMPLPKDSKIIFDFWACQRPLKVINKPDEQKKCERLSKYLREWAEEKL